MVKVSMTYNPFKSVSGWLLLLHGFLGLITVRADPVPTSVQYDPHFIGWFIGPTTSESFSLCIQSCSRVPNHDTNPAVKPRH